MLRCDGKIRPLWNKDPYWSKPKLCGFMIRQILLAATGLAKLVFGNFIDQTALCPVRPTKGWF
jgi:hypothetical protein